METKRGNTERPKRTTRARIIGYNKKKDGRKNNNEMSVGMISILLFLIYPKTFVNAHRGRPVTWYSLKLLDMCNVVSDDDYIGEGYLWAWKEETQILDLFREKK